MRKVYKATVRITIENENGNVTATREQIAEALENCVCLDIEVENSDNVIGNDVINGISVEWDNLQFVHNLGNDGTTDPDFKGSVIADE